MARSSNIDIMLRIRGQRQFKREVDKASADLEKMGLRGAGALGKFAKQSENLKNFGKNMTTKVTLPIVAMGALSVKAASDWESSFAGVRKTVDATETEFGQLERGIRDMAMSIPVSASEIAGIAEAAGQLGIETENILGFSRVMADLGVATNMTSEQAASQLAKFANITEMAQTDFDRLGSTVVDLGNNFATTEADIVNMGQRLAKSGAAVGLQEAEIMGLATAMSSMGIEAESGGTSMQQSLLAMNSAVLSGGDKLTDFAKVAGMSGGEFQKLFKQDAAAGLTQFTEGLARIRGEGGDVGQTLKDLGLGGQRTTAMFLALSGNTDLMTDALNTGRGAWKDNTALANEASERYKTFESQLQIMKNVLTEVGIAFGENILPHLTKFVEWLGPKVQGAMKWFGDLPGPVQAIAVAFVGLLAAVGPVTWALGIVAGGVGKMLIVGVKLAAILPKVTMAFRLFGLMMLTNPVFLVVAGIVALVAGLVLAYHKVEWFRKGVDAAFGWVRTAATNAANWVKGAAQWIGRAFQNVKQWITNAIGNAVNFIKRRWPLIVGIMLGPIGLVTALVITNFGKIKSAANSVVNWVKARFSSMVAFFRSMPGKIASATSGLFNGLKDAFRSAVNWIIQKWNSLELKIGGQEVSMPGPIPDMSIPDITLSTPDIPMLAKGGTAVRSGLSVVGDAGPELLHLPKAASVVPLNREVVREVTGGGGGTYIFQSVLDGKVVAESVFNRLEDARAAA